VLFFSKQRSHELQQEYELELKEASTVTLRALRVQNRLYESPVESQLMMVYDEHKRFLGARPKTPFVELFCVRLNDRFTKTGSGQTQGNAEKWGIFSAGASDAWPEELKLPKGKATVIMQIR
jgi:hypothetical protein